jgi:hypothetical protein
MLLGRDPWRENPFALVISNRMLPEPPPWRAWVVACSMDGSWKSQPTKVEFGNALAMMKFEFAKAIL